MLNHYLPVLILFVVALVVATGMVAIASILPRLFRLRRPSPQKNLPYECGMTPIGTARERQPVKFYLVAMLFLLFDVEAIFLYPWAVVHHTLGWLGWIEMTLFILALGLGYLYLLKRGALEWE